MPYSLVMISTTEDLKARTGWDGKAGKSRRDVLESIEGISLVDRFLMHSNRISHSNGTGPPSGHAIATSQRFPDPTMSLPSPLRRWPAFPSNRSFLR